MNARPFGRAAHVHFWTARDTGGLDQWDPDLDPSRFATGYGHTFLELYRRLAQSHYSVSIGPRAPRHTTSLVASLEDLTNWLAVCEPSMVRGLAREVLRCGAPLHVIRADVHPWILAPVFTQVEYVATPRAVEDPGKQIYLPLLPQRGLVARDLGRGSRVENVVLKAYSDNVPAWLDETYRVGIEELGLSIRIETELDGGAAWADFRHVDVALCSQPVGTMGDPARKPPTKLVNAWCAGAIPIVIPMMPYAEVGVAGVNMLVADGPASLMTELRLLVSDAERSRALLDASVREGLRYLPDEVAAMWWESLRRRKPLRRGPVVITALRELVAAIRRRLSLDPPG